MWLTRLALRNPVLILMMSLMAVTLGITSLNRLSVDLFPEINIPVIRVATFYNGAGPADIEKTITQPIERAVAASPGVDRVESASKQGVSVVSVWFNFGVNLDNAQFEVQQRVSQILNTLPPGVQQPFILKFDITNIPVVQIAITGDDIDERALYDLSYNVIEPQLERINGVASATVGGGRIRELEVLADRDALRARGLSLLELVSAVQHSNFLLPSGSLKTRDRDMNVFTNTQVANIGQLRDIVVAPPSASALQAVRVADVAEVRDMTADQAEIVRVNGKRGVYMRVLKQPGANTIAVVDAVSQMMPQLRGVPDNVKLAISFDQSSYIRAAVSSLEHEAVQGGILAVIVILIFLVSLRATGIVGVAIPLSIVATFILLYFTGQSLNVFTMGGLALGVGRLVDDSIVELENIHRHLGLGQTRKQAVLAAAQEVAMPILVSTITTIVVFLPVLFLNGVARNLFLPLALTISFALTMSFFVSRTVTPLLCMLWLREHSEPTRGLGARILAALDWLDERYARALALVLRHRAITIGVILGLFGVSLLLGKRIGTEFFPDSDESQFQIIFKAPIGTKVTDTEQLSMRLEDLVQRTLGPGRAKDGHKSVVGTLLTDDGLPAGRTALFTANTGPHAGNINVNLVPKASRDLSDVAAADIIRKGFATGFPGAQMFMFTGGIVKRILNFGSPAPIDVEILGYDLDQGSAYANAIAGRLRTISDAAGKPVLTDVQVSREENYPELDVIVDREKAGRLGLSEQQVAQNVLTTLVGNTQFAPIPFTDPRTGNEYFINVRAKDDDRSHVSDLEDVTIRAPGGEIVALSTVARVKRGSGPVLINRKYLQRIIDVTANVAPTADLGTAAALVRAEIDQAKPPEGFTVQLGGQAEAQKQAFAGLGFAAVMALLLVYMVLASQFKSLVDPLVIMFSVPLGITGVFIMLFATGTTLSVNSFMGIIMMVGIVVSNGVLLVDFANVLRRRGKPLVEATIEAGRTRLRPILMTTIATLTGLAPMAIGFGEGSETNLPLARAVIGGLAVSTVFTLFLVPSLYTLLDRFARRTALDEEEPGVLEAEHA